MRTILRLISSLSMGVSLAIFTLGMLIPQRAEASPTAVRKTCSGNCVCSFNPNVGYFCGGTGTTTGCSTNCLCNTYFGICLGR